MIDFAEVERLNLRDNAALARLDSILGEAAGFAETRTAFELSSILKKKAAGDPSITQKLEPFIAKFTALGLPLCNDEETIAVLDHMQAILADERVSLYERLRARLLVVPQSMRGAFARAALARIHASSEPFGGAASDPAVPSTVGAWVTAFDAAGSNPEKFFATPYIAGLSEETNHAVRHLIHIIGLLSSPDSVEAHPVTLPKPAAAVEAPPVPANLPVEPSPPKVPERKPVPAPQTPVKLPTVAPAAAVAAPPALQPSAPFPSPASVVPVPPTQPLPAKGPSAAAVIARLQQAQVEGPPTPPTVAHLTPEDHEEIKGHTERLATFEAGPNVHDTLSPTIESIAKDNGLTFGDENLRRRFVTIMTSRIKEIRNAPDTLELLTRATKVGGMGYEPEIAEKLVMRASDEAAKFATEEGVKQLSEQQQRVVVPTTPKPPRIPVEPPPQPVPQAPKPVPVPLPSPPPPRPAMPVRIPVQQVPASPAVPSGFVPPMPTASSRPPRTERFTIADIRGAPRLVGPVEELRVMTLGDFRHLGDGPIACIRRVYEKIQLIGKESYTKRAEGIKAWRDSETYQLYLSMGQASLLTGKTIRDIIAERQRANEPSLTEQEFSLVADLNHKLRY